MRAPVQAVIMAGGEGSRLRPLTSNLPKPMLPVANRPLMQHIIELLRKHGITDVVATVQFLSSIIRNYFGDGSDLGVSLSYATEDAPLGTAGSVANARDMLSGRFLVISGDALTDIDLEEVVDFHESKGAAATLVLKRMQDPLEFGIVMTSDDGRVERFLEKPTWGQVFTDTINTGIYVLEADVLDLIPVDQPYDFSSELFPLMLDKGLPVFGFITETYWTDVGNTDAYLQAQYDVLEQRVDIPIAGFEVEKSVWVGEGVDLDPTARLQGPVLVGDNARISAGARIGPLSVLAPNSTIGEEASVAHGVVLDGAHVGSYARVRGGIVGRGASLDSNATLEEGAVLGDDVAVGASAVIRPRVKVYPSRTVESGAIVSQSIVREKQARRALFGARGVSGLMNVGVTPITAIRLGMAWGSTLPRGSVIVAGRDASRAARTMKRAIIAGLNSTGVTVRDLELMPMPLTRFIAGNHRAAGGLSVRTSPGNREGVEIRLFDADGADLPEVAQRKVERAFFREDYRRASPRQLGELEFPPHAVGQYVAGMVEALDVEAIRNAGLKAVVDFAFGSSSLVAPSIMGRLGCDVLSLNAFADENRPVLTSEDLPRLLENLADKVRSSRSDLGVLLEPGGEVAHLVDDSGRVVGDERALLAFLAHEAQRGAGQVAVPVSASSRCSEVAAAAHSKLVWTPTGLPALMARARRPEVGFAGNAEGALIFPDFLAAPDGLMTFCKTLELIATRNKALSDLVDALPEVHIAKARVRTPWALKGAVMRSVASSGIPGRLLLLDGVKVIQDDRWALVIPHPDEPLSLVWAEARSGEESEALARRFATLVEEVVAEAEREAGNETTSQLVDKVTGKEKA
jgi:mannose-1-phosphate guanylyltransferase/phosphomannomutase